MTFAVCLRARRGPIIHHRADQEVGWGQTGSCRLERDSTQSGAAVLRKYLQARGFNCAAARTVSSGRAFSAVTFVSRGGNGPDHRMCQHSGTAFGPRERTTIGNRHSYSLGCEPDSSLASAIGRGPAARIFRRSFGHSDVSSSVANRSLFRSERCAKTVRGFG
jgi:hypothetical protein